MKNLFSGKCALVVDDFGEFRLSVKRLLEELGFTTVYTAGNGNDAIRSYIQYQPDLVLCDYNLGEGKNGQQVLEELHFREAFRYDCAFVLTTAERQMETVMGALEYKPDDYLTKPFNKTSLFQRIHRVIALKMQLKPVYRAMNKHEWALAIAELTAVDKKQPRLHAMSQQLLATCLERNNELNKALQVCRQVLQEREVGWALLMVGRICVRQQNYQPAKDSLLRLIKINNKVAEAYDLLATIAEQEQQPEQALEYLQDALSLSPHSVPRQRQMAIVAEQNDDWPRALKARRMAYKQGKNSVFQEPEDNVRLAATLLQAPPDSRNKRRIISECDQIIKDNAHKNKGHPRTALYQQLIHSQLLCMQGQQSKASQQLSTLTKEMKQIAALQDPELIKLCRSTLEQAQHPDVLADFESWVNEGSSTADNTHYSNRAGIEAYRQGDLSEAVALFEQALQAHPQSIIIRLNLLQALLKQQTLSPSPARDEQLTQLFSELGLMGNNHPQFSRLQQLKNSYRELKKAELS